MLINPSDIRLNAEQQAYLASLSERTGTPWPDLLGQFVPIPKADAQSPKADAQSNESALDVAVRLGLVGSCESDPADLATHSDHMVGFGKHEHGEGSR